MWHKSFAGLLSGLLFFLFVPPAFSLIFPQFTAVIMTLGILIFMPAWAGIMTYCYAAHSSKQAWFRAANFVIPSIAFYLLIFLSIGLPE